MRGRRDNTYAPFPPGWHTQEVRRLQAPFPSASCRNVQFRHATLSTEKPYFYINKPRTQNTMAAKKKRTPNAHNDSWVVIAAGTLQI